MEVAMGLNIKDERVHELAQEANYDEELIGIRRKRLRALLDSLPPPPHGATSDHGDLYDEDGLPI
jgi:hypothetical protein